MKGDTDEKQLTEYMAIMATEQKDTEGLGPIGLFREGFKVLVTHFKFFLLVQLTLFSPLAIINIACESVMFWHLPELLSPISEDSRAHDSHNFVLLYLNSVDSPLQQAMFLASMLLITAVTAIMYQGAINVSSAATRYAVGLHYTGQSVYFKDVLKDSLLPSLWMRLTVTTTCGILLLHSIILVQTVGYIVLKQYSPQTLFTLTGGMVEALMSLVFMLCISMVFAIATSVSVMEKDYGWAAVSKSLKLLKGRIKVALPFQLLWLLPTFVEVYFKGYVQSQILEEADFSPRRLIVLVLDIILCSGWMTLICLMTSILSGVQYVSFKTYHSEDLLESFSEKQTLAGGYGLEGGYGLVAAHENDNVKV